VDSDHRPILAGAFLFPNLHVLSATCGTVEQRESRLLLRARRHFISHDLPG
jgi:hypothetical protein